MSNRAAEDTMKDHALFYALGTLTQNEARAFEDHLADGCDECAAELQTSEQLTRSLAFDAADLEPPARVLERLVTFVTETPQPAAIVQNEPGQLTTVRKDEGVW